jgi:hypothetical protein
MEKEFKSGSQKCKSTDVNSIVISKIQNTDIISKQDSIENIECKLVHFFTSESEYDDPTQAAIAEKREQEVLK